MDLKRVASRIASFVRIQWVRPDLDEEAEEIAQQARDLGIDEAKLRAALEQGRATVLSDALWQSLENTDSWDTRTIEDVQEKAAVYQKDLKSVWRGFTGGGTMASPMVVTLQDGRNWLVGGNTRLMCCRALGIRPTVLLGKLS